VLILLSGVASIIRRGPLKPAEARAKAQGPSTPAGLDPVAVATASEVEAGGRRAAARIQAESAAAAFESPDRALPPDGEPVSLRSDASEQD
jgi:hypothetical protein